MNITEDHNMNCNETEIGKKGKPFIKRKNYLYICLIAFLVFSAVMFIGHTVLYYYPIIKELITTGALS